MLSYREAVFSIILIVIVSANLSEGSPPTSRPTVTNNDIRDAILQIVNVIRATEDKLERHEYRERVLGEHVKRVLVSLDKRVKQWDHFKGAITRLDERLAAVETILIQKEERERQQSMKTFDAVDDIKKNLPVIMEELKNNILDELAEQKKSTPPLPPPLPPKPEITKLDFEDLKHDIVRKTDSINESITKMEKELKKVKVEKSTCDELNAKTKENIKNLDKKMEDEVNLLRKYENRLVEYKDNFKEFPAQIKEQADWQLNFLKSMKEQTHHIDDIRTDLKNLSTKLDSLPQNDHLEEMKNYTNILLNEINEKTNDRALDIIKNISSKIGEVKVKVNKDHEEIKNSIDGLGNKTEQLHAGIDSNFEQMRSDLGSIKKVDKVIVQTAENVLDTKRRLEYGVHQILGEMGKLMKSATKDIANTITDRFDVFELSVLDDENDGFANLTTKIGDEIGQVWRQIGIMDQILKSNADILTKLENQTSNYINGSAIIIDNIKGKVANITSKIAGLDDNLNYLMGKLMLVSKEFNETKTGLSKALDGIKDTFKTVQKKMKDNDPGPHAIENSDLDATPTPAKK